MRLMDDKLHDLWIDFSSAISPKTKDKKNYWNWLVGLIQSVRFSQAGFDATGLDLERAIAIINNRHLLCGKTQC